MRELRSPLVPQPKVLRNGADAKPAATHHGRSMRAQIVENDAIAVTPQDWWQL